MIPLNIDDPVVLRRTLEDLEAKIIVVATPISPINKLNPGSTLEVVEAKVNEIVDGFNAVVVALNATNTSDRP